MGKIKFDKPKHIIKNKTFYIALTVSLVAMGIISYMAVARLRHLDNSATPAPGPIVSIAETDKPIDNVPYPETDKKTESETDPESQDFTAVPSPRFLTMPITGKILKDFNDQSLQYSQTYQDWRLHLGVDIATDRGNTVYACGDGFVEDIYQDDTLGLVVAIDHSDGMIAYYCGLDDPTTVKIGDIVESGTPIGTVDTVPCESVEQSHLHFEIEIDGVPVSPLETIEAYQPPV